MAETNAMLSSIERKSEHDEFAKKVLMLTALSMVSDVTSSIPAWAMEGGGGGSWYASNYGFTGPTACLSPDLLAEVGLTLPQFIDILLGFRE